MATRTAASSIALPRLVMAQDSITRPANTTQYGDGDALSDNATTPTTAGYFTLPLAAKKGGGILIQSATLHKTDVDETAADFDILLFDTAPAVAGFKDNAQIAITDAEFLTCQGVIRFVNGSWTNGVTGNIQTQDNLNLGFVPVSTGVSVIGIVALAGTYTPASAEVFTLTMTALQF